MADLTGIENVGDFFSAHYLTELLDKDIGSESGDLAAAIDKAKDALFALARPLNKIATEAPRFTTPKQLYALSHPFQVNLAEALGFDYQNGSILHLADGHAVPALHVAERHGEPYVAVLEGRMRTESEALLDILWTLPIDAKWLKEGIEAPPDTTYGEVISAAFEVEAPPRWIVFISGTEILLAERARWGRGQYLRFDASEILGRKDPKALRITAALLCRASLVPDSGTLLHDRLDENSHKHAQGVSADLKFAAREAVELIANEWVHYQRTTAKKAIHGEKVARELTEECLVYLYRLLVLFYVEARAGEFNILPMNSEEYARGYSLETLRDLEQATLGPDSREGFFFHESLTRLFKIVNDGFDPKPQLELPGSKPSSDVQGKDQRGFRIEGLRSPLFDPRSTPRLSKIRFRNEVLQKVVRLLSLTPEARRGRSAKAWGRGRISYAQLGINQLGAVYEGLLSFSGFFARERLYEVHRAGESGHDVTQQAWFVPERDIVKYTHDELLFGEGENKKHRKYEPGTFIYRLAGRDRESSASYYTPEVLTRCLVKYALRELLPGKSAEEILSLNICEPAMGSGAFLVEAIDQLADAYLEKRRQEMDNSIPPDSYALEKQRVKSYLAEARCYGVDLNPMAAKLAGVSLWLSTLHKGQATPWYGARLAVGNSLVGARLEVWAADDFLTDEPLAKVLGNIAKKFAASDDLDKQLEMAFKAHEAKHGQAVAEVRSRLERVKRLAGSPAEGEEGGEESAENEASEAEQAEAQRKEVVKALKKLASELKLPRHHRQPPRKVPAKDVLSGSRPGGSVWHFLVPDAGMSPFEGDKVVAELAPDAVRALKEWRKDIEEPWSAVDVRRLQGLSARVDALYTEYVHERQRVLDLCTPGRDVWGLAEKKEKPPSIEQRTEMLAAIQQPGKAFFSLSRVMNLWAALWAFPLEHAHLLPKRETWLRALEEALGVEGVTSVTPGQISIWPKDSDDEVEAAPAEKVTLWTAVDQACERLRPLHWELTFPEVFVNGGGFDLVVGNPPWIKVEWNERGILEEMEPRIALDGLSASEVAKRRPAILADTVRTNEYLQALGQIEGARGFLGAPAYFPSLVGIATNLYKSFVARCSLLLKTTGIVGFVQEDALFDDPRGGNFRRDIYQRLRILIRFYNELKLFPDVGNKKRFALMILRAAQREDVRFVVLANAFHPTTVDDSFSHDGNGKVPGFKTEDNKFELRGHSNRIVEAGSSHLDLFAKLFDRAGTPTLEARLPLVHSQDVLDVMAKLANHSRRLADIDSSILGTEMWHETGAQKDGTIRRNTQYPKSVNEWILSGPHFYVGTPLSKTPREVCDTKQAYDSIDGIGIGNDYLPRTNYVPACAIPDYTKQIPRFRTHAITDFYRHVHRRMLAASNERSLIGALIPPGAAHIHTVVGFAIEPRDELVAFEAFSESLPVDFFIRTKGGSELNVGTTKLLPIPVLQSPLRPSLITRALRLNCLTTHYADLWNEVWPQVASAPAWSIDDPRLCPWPTSTTTWHRHCALRNHFERRWALVEIDALAALELKLTIDELCTIYRTQFPVLREYEKNTWYDKNGRIAFTTNRGLTGVGLERKQFEIWQACLKNGEALPKGFERQNLEPPFEVRDREADMRTAYAYFAARLGLNKLEIEG